MIDPLELAINAAATFGSVLFGFALAMWLDRKKQKDEEAQIVNRTIDSVMEEIRDIRDKLQNAKRRNEWIKAPAYGYEVIKLSTTAFDSLVNAGNFGVFQPEVQTGISKLYSLIQRCNSLVERITTVYATQIYGFNRPEADKIALSMHQELESKYSELLVIINTIVPDR